MAKKLDDVATSFATRDRFSAAEESLSSTVTVLPNISPVRAPDPTKKRRNSSVSMPIYVWDLVRDYAHKNREPQNVLMMRALKLMGLPIDETDLVDPRTVRYED